MKFKNNKLIKIFLLIIIIIFSFLCWYLIREKNYFSYLIQTENKINTLGVVPDLSNNKTITNIDFKLFNEAYKIISDNYYSFNKTSKNDLIYGIVKWLVTSLWDKHSEFFNPEETKKFNETLEWDFEWIWAVIQKNDFWVIVDRLIAGAPAKDAWILIWDIIIKADNNDLKDLDLISAVNKIRWPDWTKVILEIIRSGEKEILTKEVVRKKITIPSLESKVLDKNTWYIILSIFWEKSWEEFKTTLNDLYSKNISWLILDLRDNWWWYLETAVSILSDFIDKDKVLVVTKDKTPNQGRSYFSYWNSYKKIPIMIIINWNSASASEIVAGAIKDYKLGIIVWEKSYGKGSVQQPFILSDGSELKITTAKWYTPLDHSIDGEWITPDIEIILNKEDYEKKYDRQLEETKLIMQKYIELKDVNGVIEFYDNLKKEKEKEKLDNITSSWAKK